ncbi:MAG: DUF4129 domain-containing protein, partial [Pseudonocardia sp.]
MSVVAGIRVDIGRDEAQRAAERELSDPVYAADDPSLVDRGVRWLLERISDLLDRAADASPGGYGGLAVLTLLVVLTVVAVRLRVGRIGRTAAGERALFDAGPRSAEDHRAAADTHAARGEWADAVRERLRAVVRSLEERDLLDTRAGRTADEAADEAGRVLPGCAEQLRTAAMTFDDVWYGARPATAAMDAQLRSADDAVRRARPGA